MSQVQGTRGVANPRLSKPASAIATKAPRQDAGDLSDASENTSSLTSGNRGDSVLEYQKFPENIHKRLNALRNLHMETRKREQEMQVAIFKLEAEHYKNVEKLFKKRLDIITGKYEPNEHESKFSLKDKEVPLETAPHDGQMGIPKFWLVVLNYAAHTADLIRQCDIPVLEFLKDIRVEYKERPLGFTLCFEFLSNPYFSNTVLTRSFEYDTNLSPLQLYSSSGLMPTTTLGCTINWKDGKDITKKSAGPDKPDRRAESFFDFFTPVITDLSQIGPLLASGNDEELLERAEQAGIEYETASALRGRIIPRALLFYTGEADAEGVDESEYSDDYSESDDEIAEKHGFKDDDSDNEEPEAEAPSTSKV